MHSDGKEDPLPIGAGKITRGGKETYRLNLKEKEAEREDLFLKKVKKRIKCPYSLSSLGDFTFLLLSYEHYELSPPKLLYYHLD